MQLTCWSFMDQVYWTGMYSDSFDNCFCNIYLYHCIKILAYLVIHQLYPFVPETQSSKSHVFSLVFPVENTCAQRALSAAACSCKHKHHRMNFHVWPPNKCQIISDDFNFVKQSPLNFKPLCKLYIIFVHLSLINLHLSHLHDKPF